MNYEKNKKASWSEDDATMPHPTYLKKEIMVESQEEINVNSWYSCDNSLFPGNIDIKKINSKDLIDIVDNDNTFHIGQSYEDKPASLIKCLICGATEFNVGKGEYFTAIRCKNCKYEVCIHEG